MTQEALNIAGQCRATASSELAKNILVDEGNGLLTELLLDAARIIEALAQSEQEPVAWFSPSGNLYKTRFHATANGEQVVTPLYTSPPQRTWVGLTDEDISEIVRGTHNTGSFVRAISAKLKELNT